MANKFLSLGLSANASEEEYIEAYKKKVTYSHHLQFLEIKKS